MPLPSREAAAPFGLRYHRSLPHTIPGVWFVLRTALQASSCLPALDVRKVDGTLRPQSRAAPSGVTLARDLPRRYPAAWSLPF